MESSAPLQSKLQSLRAQLENLQGEYRPRSFYPCSLLSQNKPIESRLSGAAPFVMESNQQEVFGIPQGSITEVVGSSGSGKREWLIRFLAQNSGLNTLWMESPLLQSYPPIFEGLGVNLRKVVFLQAPTYDPAEEQAVLVQALQSQLFKVIVWGRDVNWAKDKTPPRRRALKETQLRALQLAAKRSQTALLILSSGLLCQKSWPFALRLKVRRVGGGV